MFRIVLGEFIARPLSRHLNRHRGIGGKEEEEEEIACRRVYGGNGAYTTEEERKELQQVFSPSPTGLHAINGLLPPFLLFPFSVPQMYTGAFSLLHRLERSSFQLISNEVMDSGDFLIDLP